MQDLFDHAVLRARQPEGKRAEKRVHAAGFIRCGVQFRSRRAQDGQACRENKKFLKNEPFPRPLQRVPAFWRVVGGICLRYAAVSGYTGSRRFVTVPGLSASSKAGFAICMPYSSSAP